MRPGRDTRNWGAVMRRVDGMRVPGSWSVAMRRVDGMRVLGSWSVVVRREDSLRRLGSWSGVVRREDSLRRLGIRNKGVYLLRCHGICIIHELFVHLSLGIVAIGARAGIWLRNLLHLLHLWDLLDLRGIHAWLGHVRIHVLWRRHLLGRRMNALLDRALGNGPCRCLCRAILCAAPSGCRGFVSGYNVDEEVKHV
jgi:hypothetical protein